jgi:hypothetical protein
MTRPVSNTHHAALLAVQHGRVVQHSGCGVHVQGWAWSCGSDMPELFQSYCDDLRWAGYITVGSAEFCGNKVTVTQVGISALTEWAAAVVGGGA